MNFTQVQIFVMHHIFQTFQKHLCTLSSNNQYDYHCHDQHANPSHI
jgi:hypothetical protein